MLGVKERHRRPILRLVKKRSRHHLIPLLVKHVQPGTLILSDEWRAYRGALTNLGYRHFTVNHSRGFVDPLGLFAEYLFSACSRLFTLSAVFNIPD
ncbi:unnamed protein product [Leuciscus chuanchicus]